MYISNLKLPYDLVFTICHFTSTILFSKKLFKIFHKISNVLAEMDIFIIWTLHVLYNKVSDSLLLTDLVRRH